MFPQRDKSFTYFINDEERIEVRTGDIKLLTIPSRNIQTKSYSIFQILNQLKRKRVTFAIGEENSNQKQNNQY